MATGGSAVPRWTVGTPDARTRSIWLTQLVLAASVVVICVLVLALQPDMFTRWGFTTGAFAIVVVTVATLVVPWTRLPHLAVLSVPFIDAVAIALMANKTEQRFGFLWLFPVMWVAMHFAAVWLAAMLAMIGTLVLLEAALNPSSEAALRIFVVMLSLTFIGITAHLALRRTRALRRLLRRQARRLTNSLERHSRQEKRTVEILNGIDTGIVRLSAGGRVLTVNDAYARLYGLDPLDPSVPARSVEYTSLRGMPVPLSERPFNRAARGETFTDAKVWLFTREGEWRALSISAKRLSGTDEDEEGILLLVHDVTAITQAQLEREQLAAMASHELKHPLTVMIGNAELALEMDELTPRTRERFESILAASERMFEMTNGLLTTTSPGFADEESMADIDLRQIVIESVGSFRPTAAAHNVEIDLRLDVPLPVTADGFRMRQVIDNLVSNAIKYTPDEGRVRIVGVADGPDVTVTVSDNGIGISAEDLPKIATPYFRAEDARQTASGTGLGLGITSAIVSAHGGTLDIESEKGVGTTVALRLPRSVGATPRVDEEARS